MLMDREALARRVLADPRIEVYECGRTDIRAGRIDRRVLATMLYLAASGLKPDDLLPRVRPRRAHHIRQRVRAQHGHRDGHRGDQRHHHHPRHTGPWLDRGTGGPAAADPAGGDEAPPDHLADDVRRRDNTFAMGDHDDHIHVGWQPETANGRAAVTNQSVLKPSQWAELTDRIADIDNPDVRDEPSPPRKRVP